MGNSTDSRRSILKGLAATAIVLGFDPVGRSWVTEAHASTPLTGLPALDGVLSVTPADLAAASDDWGHIVHRTPLAVLFAASVKDIVKMVRYARQHDLKIVGRGNGHTTFGQSQTEAGIVIDMRALNQIHAIHNSYAEVDAGVVWRDLLLATTAVGRTPPVLTDYTQLTVGGTLSVGGVGGMSWRRGAQVDNVKELTVVTGKGDVIVCSRTSHKHLFDAALGGLGLCAIIVRAKVRLIRAKERARTFTLPYSDVPTMLTDLRTLVAEKRFQYVRGNCLPGPTSFSLHIEATKYYTPDEDEVDEEDGAYDCCLDQDSLLAGLSFIPGTVVVEDRTYFEYCDVTNQLFALLGELGLNALPHPWLDLFVPGSAMNSFSTENMANMDLSLFLPGSIILFFVFDKQRTSQPMFRVPDEDQFFLFDVIRTAPPDPAVINYILADNRRMFEENRALGGTNYTISSVALSRPDWQAHFGSAWPLLALVKAAHDPDSVLGAGVDVFC